MQEFVILFHELPFDHHRRSHWDFMLEDQTELLTWELSQNPMHARVMAAERLPNHRMEYLNFEGEFLMVGGASSKLARDDSSGSTNCQRTIGQSN